MCRIYGCGFLCAAKMKLTKEERNNCGKWEEIVVAE